MRRLLIRPGAIGDCILSLPALEALTGGSTEVWVAAQNVPLIRFAAAVHSIASTGLDLLEIEGPTRCAPLIERLAAFDLIVSWYGAARPEFRSVVSALNLPFHFLSALPDGPGRHAVDFYLEQVRPLALRRVQAVPRLPCPAVQGNFAVIHPFSGSRRKNWPIERFRQVARRLEQFLPVAWCAGPEEELPEACRFDDLYELACWLAGARLYLGNDSGVTHLAAAVGAPVVAVFGPTDPRIWAPRGERVRVVATDEPGRPIECVPVEAVLEAALALLEPAPQSGAPPRSSGRARYQSTTLPSSGS